MLKNTAFTTPTTTTKKGESAFYAWATWTDAGEKNGTVEDSELTVFDSSKGVAGDTTLYTMYGTPDSGTWTVTFDYNTTGYTTYGTDKVAKGAQVSEPPAPTDPDDEKGRPFLYWTTADKKGTDTAESQAADEYAWSAPGLGAITLYAVWGDPTVGQYTVTFDENYVGGAITKVTADADNKVSAPAAPVREGYEFKGWYDNGTDGSGNLVIFPKSVSENTTFYAKWQKIAVSDFDEAATDLSGQTDVFTKDSLNAYKKAYKAAVEKYDLTGDPLDGSKLSDDELTEATEAFQAAQALLVVKTSETAPVYRVYNKADNKHLYTSDHAEALSLIAGGWRYEGVAYYARTQGGVAVYRAYSPSRYEHLFTTSEAEYETATTAQGEGWYRAENIAFYTEK